MPYPVGVGVLHVPAHTVGTRMDNLAGERIALQHETVRPLLEAGIRRQQVAREEPEPFIEAVEVIVALDAHLLYHFLVKVIEELLAGIALSLSNLSFQLALELVELELNLLRCATLVIDG